MARNVVTHGFGKDNKNHYLEARVISRDDKITLRIKDDCIPFDPVEMAGHLNPDDITANIGIKMVMKIADDVSYWNLMGLNVLTISFFGRQLDTPDERSARE